MKWQHKARCENSPFERKYLSTSFLFAFRSLTFFIDDGQRMGDFDDGGWEAIFRFQAERALESHKKTQVLLQIFDFANVSWEVINCTLNKYSNNSSRDSEQDYGLNSCSISWLDDAEYKCKIKEHDMWILKIFFSFHCFCLSQVVCLHFKLDDQNCE